VARELEARVDEFAELETLDTGKPLGHARGEISGCVAYLDYYAGAADKIHGETVPLGPDYLNYTVREPLGVTAHIVPWNMPLSMVCRSLAPALAAGNTAVVKPAEQTPLTALLFAEVFLKLGFPPGVYNVVPGFGHEAGKALSEHPGIDSITFTGSVETGRNILRAAAEHVKPVVLELGGKSPQVIFADTDLDLAAGEVAKGIYSNTGQYCDAGSRLVVEEEAREPLLDRLLEHSRRIKLGRGMDDPDMGPLVSAEHLERVLGYIDTGQREGANMLIGGRAEELKRGYFVSPTVFDEVESKMRIAQEEIFGPVLSVLSFSGDDEAATIANDSDYGLAAGIFTRDIDRALRFADEIQAGYVMINEYFTGGMGSPFGGYKQSGIGREKGLVALDNYTQIKNVVVKVGHPNGERPR
jgi:aldehyde dehydrogenase (NAD+)